MLSSAGEKLTPAGNRLVGHRTPTRQYWSRHSMARSLGGSHGSLRRADGAP